MAQNNAYSAERPAGEIGSKASRGASFFSTSACSMHWTTPSADSLFVQAEATCTGTLNVSAATVVHPNCWRHFPKGEEEEDEDEEAAATSSD